MDETGWHVILNIFRMLGFLFLWYVTEPEIAYAFALYSICFAIEEHS